MSARGRGEGGGRQTLSYGQLQLQEPTNHIICTTTSALVAQSIITSIKSVGCRSSVVPMSARKRGQVMNIHIYICTLYNPVTCNFCQGNIRKLGQAKNKPSLRYSTPVKLLRTASHPRKSWGKKNPCARKTLVPAINLARRRSGSSGSWLL